MRLCPMCANFSNSILAVVRVNRAMVINVTSITIVCIWLRQTWGQGAELKRGNKWVRKRVLNTNYHELVVNYFMDFGALRGDEH